MAAGGVRGLCICRAIAYYSIKIALLRVLNLSGQLSETRTRTQIHADMNTYKHTHTGPTGTHTHALAINVTAEAREFAHLFSRADIE